MKAAWASDIHLDFVDDYTANKFFQIINETVDILLLTGDIGDGSKKQLERLARGVEIPTYFVLGNHDYYHNSIEGMRRKVKNICRKFPHLTYLPDNQQVVELLPDVALIGVDGWADAQYGNMLSNVVLWDFSQIENLKEAWVLSKIIKSRQPLHDKLRELGIDEAVLLENTLGKCLEKYNNVIILTHIPPFKEATWHLGQVSGPDFLPYFSCAAVGNVIENIFTDTDKNALVLCGHTHSRGTYNLLPNVQVWTAKAEYRFPEIEMSIDVENVSRK